MIKFELKYINLINNEIHTRQIIMNTNDYKTDIDFYVATMKTAIYLLDFNEEFISLSQT